MHEFSHSFTTKATTTDDDDDNGAFATTTTATTVPTGRLYCPEDGFLRYVGWQCCNACVEIVAHLCNFWWGVFQTHCVFV